MLGKAGGWLRGMCLLRKLPALPLQPLAAPRAMGGAGLALTLPAHGGAPRRLIGSVLVLNTPELARSEG
jgi:hypothetical protein